MISWREGEEYASEYLRDHGYRIEERNFRTRRGEIDIIAIKDDTLVCVEVKTWKGMGLESMEKVLGRKKQHTYFQLCRYFLSKKPEYRQYFVRFDLICIDAATGMMEHLVDAFRENG